MLNLINQIAASSGNAKMKVMKQHPELKQIMELTYNPFKRYNITASKEITTGKYQTQMFTLDHKRKLDVAIERLLKELETGLLSGKKALKMVSATLAMLSPDDAELLRRIIGKDLKCGISVKTINKVWPNLIPETETNETIPTYLLKTFVDKKAKFPCLAAPKLDGVRGRFKNGVMYSRQGKVIQGLDHICDILPQYGTDFDGEITIPGLGFDEASGLIRSDNQTPDAVYNIFDIPNHKGDKAARWITLSALSGKLISHKGLNVILHYAIDNMEQLQFSFKESLVDMFEGLVYYDPHSYYKDGRGYDWMRLIPKCTADCECIGFFEGKKRLEGTLGGIIVDYKGKLVKVGTGFTLGQRDTIWQRRDTYEGMIVEIEYKEETKAGVMRQPSFKGWRIDKIEPNFD